MMSRSLLPFGRLDRHVARLFVASYLTALLIVVGLFLVLDMAGNLDEFLSPRDGRTASGLAVVRYYALSLPFLYVQVAPFVTLVAGMFAVTRLVRHQETVAAMAAGVSLRRWLVPILLLGLVSSGVVWQLRETLAGRPLEMRESLHHYLVKKDYNLVVENLWIRDGKGGVVGLPRFLPRGEAGAPVVEGLDAYLMNAREWTSVRANRAVWDEAQQAWILEGGTRRALQGDQPAERVTRLEGLEFTPSLALTYQRARQAPLELSFEQAKELSRRDPDNIVYQTLLQYHVTFPLANFVLLLVGLPLLLRHERSHGARGVLWASLAALLYFSMDFVCRNLGLQGTLQPELSAWLPTLTFGALGVALIDSIRT